MTNREKYKQAFSAVHIPVDFIMEEESMNKPAKLSLRPAAVVLAACTLIMGTATTAYAADIGGIQRTVQIWTHGEMTSATVTFDENGHYSMEYTDDEGNIQQHGGGGIAIGPDGAERPLTEEELMENLSMPEVEYEDDNSVIIYWNNQGVDITDKFMDDYCYVKLIDEHETFYVTVEYQNGFAVSSSKYIMPDELN